MISPLPSRMLTPRPSCLPPIQDADPEAKELVLDPSQDEFYRKHVFANYGDVAVDVKGLMDQFQSKTEKHKQAGGGEERIRGYG